MTSEDFGSEYIKPDKKIGCLRGSRSFRVDKMGRLVAKHQAYIWLPGENVADCRNELDVMTAALAAAGRYVGGGGSVSQAAGINYVPNTWTTTTTTPIWASPVSSSNGVYSINYDFPFSDRDWLEKQLEVEKARRTTHRAADINCQCGFYAYFDDGQNSYFKEGEDVLGIIEGYGQVTAGTRGFKAEKAKIVALCVPAEEAFRLRLVVRNYKDVAIFEDRVSMLAEFPLTPNDPPGPDEDPDFWDRPL